MQGNAKELSHYTSRRQYPTKDSDTVNSVLIYTYRMFRDVLLSVFQDLLEKLE